MTGKSIDMPEKADKIELVEVRCACGKLLGKVQSGAAHEHKCSRCKQFTFKLPDLLAKEVAP